MPERRDKAKAAEADTAGPATVIVTLEEDALADLDGVRKQLEDAGLEVEEVLDFIGQIVGKSSAADIEPLRRIQGVASVEKSRAIQLPPPGSVIQ